VELSRGLKKAQVLSITEIGPKLGVFDTILMLGNNFGLFGSHSRVKWLLKRFHKITSSQARIIAETRDPCGTNLPEHLGYHEFNRKRGRMPGQLRIRIRYKKYMSPWFDYLLASKEEIEKIIADTVWMTEEFIDGKAGMYIAVICYTGHLNNRINFPIPHLQEPDWQVLRFDLRLAFV